MKARASISYLLALLLVLATGSREAQAQDDDSDQAEAERGGEGADRGDEASATSARPGARGPRRGSRRARRKARGLFKKGQRLVRTKKFDQGIAAIQAAYTLDPRVDHLYNLAVAYHLKGDKRVALDYYRKVAAEGKKKKLVRLAVRFARELESELETREEEEEEEERPSRGELRAALQDAQDARQTSEQETATTRTRLSEVESELLASREREAKILAERDRLLEDNLSRGGRGKRIIGSTLMITGGASLGVALAYALVARQASDEIDGLEPGEDAFQPGVEEIGEDADQRLLIFSIAGGVALTAGAVVYLLGERGAGDGSAADGMVGDGGVSIAPAVSQDSAGVQVFGRF